MYRQISWAGFMLSVFHSFTLSFSLSLARQFQSRTKEKINGPHYSHTTLCTLYSVHRHCSLIRLFSLFTFHFTFAGHSHNSHRPKLIFKLLKATHSEYRLEGFTCWLVCLSLRVECISISGWHFIIDSALEFHQLSDH